MRIVDPTQGREGLLTNTQSSVADVRLSGQVCLLSNSKPNANELLRSVASAIPALRGASLFAKPFSSLPAPPELLDRLARDFDAALVAIGD